MILAAHLDAAAQALGRRAKGGRRIAQAHDVGFGNEALRGQRALDVEDRRQILVFHDRQFGRLARQFERLGGNGEQDLAMEKHVLGGEHGIVTRTDRAYVVDARDVRRREHGDHAGCPTDPGKVEPAQAGMGPLGLARRQMQQSRGLGDVVDIDRLAGNVFARAVMGQRHVDAALQIRPRAPHAISHGPPSLDRSHGFPHRAPSSH